MTNTLNTLDGALTELITSTVAMAEQAGGLVMQEAPIVVEQLLKWNFTTSILGFLTGVLLVVVGLFAAKPSLRACRSGGWAYKLDCEGGVVLAWAVLLAATIAFLWNFTWLQILIAPKLYLLEYAAELIK